jgi:aldehyde:ferredoxin oxidoreductase
MYGNMGTILEVDLTSGEMEELEVEERLYRDYIGGSALAARLLYERGNLDAEPLDPEALLIFMSGPLTGVGMSGSSRFAAAARSPLTGYYGDASCGGNFGPEIKRCGFDGVIFKGRSEMPVYLLLDEEGARLVEAEGLWGKEVYEVTDILKDKHGKNAKVITVGPASENGVRFGSIHNDYGHAFGRAGMGTVMASKNLKAVVAQGKKKIDFKDEEAFKEVRKAFREAIDESITMQAMGALGTAANMEAMMLQGDVPTKNWSIGEWEDGGAALTGATLAETILTDTGTCRGCAVGCKRVVKVDEAPYEVPEGPGPEYETLTAYGTLCYNNNLAAVAKANELSNRLGVDTITCGSTIAWAIESFEKGALNMEDTDGLELNWGDPDLVIELVERIARKEGKLGELLSMGSAAAAEKVGKGSEQWLTTTKGLEAPMHDPRAFHGLGAAYAISSRGACHVSNAMLFVEWGTIYFPELGIDKDYEPMSAEDKAEAVVWSADWGVLHNSACWCEFPGLEMQTQWWVDLFNYVAGYDYDLDSMLECCARGWFMKRCLQHIWGVTGEDDKLGPRVMEPLSDGMTEDSVPDMERMMKEVYELRGLGEDGKPTRETLEKYGLEELADKI